MPSMDSYSKAAVERAMKVQEVILRAMAKKITWWQAAEIIGISDRSMRRWHERYEEFGYDGLFDRRRGQPSPKRVPLATVQQVLGFTCDAKKVEPHPCPVGQSWVNISYGGYCSSEQSRNNQADVWTGQCFYRMEMGYLVSRSTCYVNVESHSSCLIRLGHLFCRAPIAPWTK
jgi:hypothetical protein